MLFFFFFTAINSVIALLTSNQSTVAVPHLSQYSSWEPMQDPRLHRGHCTELPQLPRLHSPPEEAVEEVESHQTWECHPAEAGVVELGYQQLKGVKQVINLSEKKFNEQNFNKSLTQTACTI